MVSYLFLTNSNNKAQGRVYSPLNSNLSLKGVTMQITLYNCTADPRVVNKLTQLTAIETVNAKIVYPIQITTPVFRLKTINNYTQINYCYVPELNRYYFVDNITLESGSAIILSCSCDVLMSFRQEILALECICLRTSDNTKYNKYITDDIPSSVKATTYNYELLDTSPFEMPSETNGMYYALTLNGLVGDNQ